MRITGTTITQLLTVGRIITLTLVVLLGWYVHTKTKSWGWTIAAALGLYVVISVIFLRNCFSLGGDVRSPQFCKFYDTKLFGNNKNQSSNNIPRPSTTPSTPKPVK